MGVKIQNIKLGILSFLTSLLVSNVYAQSSDGVFDSDDTVFHLIWDFLQEIIFLSNYTRGTVEPLPILQDLAAVLLLVFLTYEALDYIGRERDISFIKGIKNKKMSKINGLMFIALLIILMMGPVLGPVVHTITGTVEAAGVFASLVFIAIAGGIVIAGSAYGAGATGNALQAGGDKLADGAENFWESDIVEASREKARNAGGQIKDLAQTSNSVDNFAASTAQLINTEVDNRNHDYCENMHQNPKGSRPGNCTVCGENIP